MEKKVTKKAAAPKKKAVAKEDELKEKAVVTKKVSVPGAVANGEVVNPFAEVTGTTVATSPVKKSAPKKVSEPGTIATGAVKKPVKKAAKTATLDVTAGIAAAPKVELSPVFKALAAPVLPELDRENRARLQMQTPTRLYFYWSFKENPYHLLKQTFGDDTGSYMLVLKLTNLRRGYEEIHATDAAGNWWFDVEPDGEYQAEIGFYAPSRPYFRVLYSNVVETPRRSPSPNVATNADWRVSANKFAEVLDVAGFSRDAFDVAMTGDDHAVAESISQTAFSSFLGGEHDLGGIIAEDIRYAMLALASGATLEELRFRVSPALFAILQANADKLVADRAMSALTEYFDIDEAEFTEEQLGAAVYGASLVNFPQTLKTRTLSSGKFGSKSESYAPVSSSDLGR